MSFPTLNINLKLLPSLNYSLIWAIISFKMFSTVSNSVSQTLAIDAKFKCWIPLTGSPSTGLYSLIKPFLSSMLTEFPQALRNPWLIINLTSWSSLLNPSKALLVSATYCWLSETGTKTPRAGNSIDLPLTWQIVLMYFVIPLQAIWNTLRAFFSNISYSVICSASFGSETLSSLRSSRVCKNIGF